MKRIWPVAAILLLLTGCGVQPSEVADGGKAATGVASGMTLYFLDDHEQLRPQLRPTGHLGSISEALALLLAGGPGDPALHTEIALQPITRVVVTVTTTGIELGVPLTIEDVTQPGIGQIVCTALAAQVQGGGSKGMTVRVRFVQPTPESDRQRTCPVID